MEIGRRYRAGERAGPRSIRAVMHAVDRGVRRAATCWRLRVILACLRGGGYGPQGRSRRARPAAHGQVVQGARAARAGGARPGQGRVLREEAEAAQRDAVSPRYPELSVQYPTIMCN